MTNQSSTDWEEEYDKKFPKPPRNDAMRGWTSGHGSDDNREVKSFIRFLLHRDRQRFAEEVLKRAEFDEEMQGYKVKISKELYDMLVRKAANPQESE